MEVKKSDILQALELVKPGLALRGFLEQTDFFIFLKDRIVTYNDEISVSCPFSGLDLVGAVRAEELLRLLSKIRQDKLRIEVVGNEMRIRTKRIEAGILFQKEIQLPLSDQNKVKEWFPFPIEVLEALKIAVFSCSKDMSMPVLGCVNVRGDGWIESSDNYRITRCKTPPIFGSIRSVLIPASSVLNLVKYQPVEAAISKGWAYFKMSNDVVFSCRVFDSEFPDVSKLMEVSRGVELKFPKNMSEILDRAMVFCENDLDSYVTVSIYKNELVVKSKSEKGWFEERSKVEFRGEGEMVSFSVVPGFLKDIVGKLRKCVVGGRKIKFFGDDWEHVICLSDS